VTFGSGANQFNMEFVTIGNPGNAADENGYPRPAGAVGYTYGIGKFEVSRDMITKFNASQSLKITLADLNLYGGNGMKKPATGVSWNEAARFVNWLNTSTGGFAAYKFTTSGVNDNMVLWTASDIEDFDVSNPYRSKRAMYVLPSYDEFHKAAYYDPLNQLYYVFPTGSNSRPTAVISGTTQGSAIYEYSGEANPLGPADVDSAGGLSPYGVMGFGGNVWEWEESSSELMNSNATSRRGIRSGDWDDSSFHALKSSNRGTIEPGNQLYDIGFRVVTLSSSAPPAVPEPSMMVIGTLFGLGGLAAKRRMKK
jgi:sulfatase modifying factor 1